eukprot:scaffold7282_cov113-Isochrysis_galbana.AAC.10
MKQGEEWGGRARARDLRRTINTYIWPCQHRPIALHIEGPAEVGLPQEVGLVGDVPAVGAADRREVGDLHLRAVVSQVAGESLGPEVAPTAGRVPGRFAELWRRRDPSVEGRVVEEWGRVPLLGRVCQDAVLRGVVPAAGPGRQVGASQSMVDWRTERVKEDLGHVARVDGERAGDGLHRHPLVISPSPHLQRVALLVLCQDGKKAGVFVRGDAERGGATGGAGVGARRVVVHAEERRMRIPELVREVGWRQS